MIKHLSVVNSEESDFAESRVSFSDLTAITNGTVNNITCTCIDELKYAERKNKIIEVIHKLCANGVLSMKIINLDLLGNKIKKKELNGEKFSEIMDKMNSVWTYSECIEFISNIDKALIIENIGFDDIYSVIQLKKT